LHEYSSFSLACTEKELLAGLNGTYDIALPQAGTSPELGRVLFTLYCFLVIFELQIKADTF
jgi:hypothetical protein